jgi:hypothetical protein
LALTVAQVATIPEILIIQPIPPPAFCKAQINSGERFNIWAVSNCNEVNQIFDTVQEPPKKAPNTPINGAQKK